MEKTSTVGQSFGNHNGEYLVHAAGSGLVVKVDPEGTVPRWEWPGVDGDCPAREVQLGECTVNAECVADLDGRCLAADVKGGFPPSPVGLPIAIRASYRSMSRWYLLIMSLTALLKS